MTVISIGARGRLTNRYVSGDNQKKHQLLAVEKARTHIGRQQRRHQRDARICKERPEEMRRAEALAAHDEEQEPAHQADGQQDLRGGDRELQRTGHTDQRSQARRFERLGPKRLPGVEGYGVGHWCHLNP